MKRHSSRRTRLDHSVLNERLIGAVAYDRIAGYFRSSLFEIAGEALSNVQGPIRIVCNSELDPEDITTAAAAQAAIRRSWCSGRPEDAPAEALPRYKALSYGNAGVLGGWTRTSPWFQASRCLAIATGEQTVPTDPNDGWQFVRDPLPARSEDDALDRISTNLVASATSVCPQALNSSLW